MPPKRTGTPRSLYSTRDFEGPRQLAGEHDGDPDEVAGGAEIDLLEVLVDERQRHLGRHGGGEDDGAVRGEVEFRLPVQLAPGRVDQASSS